ncbi:acid sphingomyelinase-like phosphodiesterase 3b [Prorops nasuta]|uniref:acid sphingomyelinase-like phosphodiesterase 3b n=1 Tax=Prorops nasuta TaxID=863751 RepID=UPI0034CE07A1
MIRDYLIFLSWICVVRGEIGYFWHITDIHYDPKYSSQRNAASRCWETTRNNTGMFGSYDCDSPWALIESAARAMETKHEGIEFVLWTGDALTRNPSMSVEQRLHCLQNLTDLLSHTFKGQFVFPALGHVDEGVNFTQLADLWKHWLPLEALDTFKKAGYYTIEQRSKKYRIVFLNTNLWLNNSPATDNRQLRGGSNALQNSYDPYGQWTWFNSVLEKARKQEETVYIVGHTPPGVDDRHGSTTTLHELHNARYLQLVRLYSDLIRGQFFGHWHSDTFRVIYSDTGSPVSWIMMAPSITPHRDDGGPNNPGLRLYKFETKTGQILDYTQFFLNLPEANKHRQANWQVEYTLLKYYDLKEITAISLHDLADRFTQTNDYAFVRYYGANMVSLPRDEEQVWGCGGALSGICALHHYCTVTRLNPSSYSACYSSYAYALASGVIRQHPPTILQLLLLALLLLCHSSRLQNR